MTQFECDKWTVTVTQDAHSLETEWRTLEDASGTFVSGFQRFDWIAPLYKHLYQDEEAIPLIICFRNTQSGALEMLWPLALEKRSVFGFLSTLSLRFADRRLCDYCVPIIAKNVPNDIPASLILDALRQAAPQADLIHFDKWIGTETETFAQLNASQFCFPYHVHAYRLPLDLEQKEIASTHFFSRHRTKYRKLNRLAPVEILSEEAGNISPENLNLFFDLRLARFAKLGRDDAFANENIKNFYEDVALGYTAQATARLTIMKTGDNIASIAFGTLAEKSFYGLASAIDGDRFYKFSPALLLCIEDIKHCREAGLRYYDFTLGDEGYKFHFKVEKRALSEIHYPITWRGQASYQLRRLKQLVRKYPQLLAFTKKIRGK